MSTPRFPQIIAHRGARSLAPENTIASARKALQNGADMWEHGCDPLRRRGSNRSA